MITFDEVSRRYRPPDATRRLNVGCGHLSKPGFVNLDIAKVDGVDVVGSVLALPFATGSMDLVECQDVLEHVDVTAAMREVHRVLRPGGVAVIQAVHFTSRDFPADPTHVRSFSNRTFSFYVGSGNGRSRDYYFDFRFQNLEFSAIQFHHGRLYWNRIVERLVNRSDRSRDLYELTGLSRLFPASNVITVLRR